MTTFASQSIFIYIMHKDQDLDTAVYQFMLFFLFEMKTYQTKLGWRNFGASRQMNPSFLKCEMMRSYKCFLYVN
jgi:hypothetical protein